MRTLLVSLPIALVASLAPFAPADPPAPTVRIGYISPQRILTDVADARADVMRLQALQQQKAADLRTKQQALETTRQQLSQASDAATRSRLTQQEQQQRTELQSAATQAQTELQSSQRQIQAALQTLVKPVIDELVKGRAMDLVLNGDTSVVWAAPGLDLTPAVIERLNAKRASPAPKP